MQIHEAMGVRWEEQARIGESRHISPLEHPGTQFPRGSAQQGDAGVEVVVNNGTEWVGLMEISFYNL
jgi:hypothetical protein